ncbi:hypothetical protein [Microbispora bryophytorum]|uniref:hypothetical protein n=1 Tax=Microbispora bryophytorum TaxID=1460882 RepID=UPI0033FF1850
MGHVQVRLDDHLVAELTVAQALIAGVHLIELGGLGGVESPDCASRTPSPSHTPGGSGCSVTYKVVGSWPGGFQAEVTVTSIALFTGASSGGWTRA